MASVRISKACISFATCQQHISDSHFATGLLAGAWSGCSCQGITSDSIASCITEVSVDCEPPLLIPGTYSHHFPAAHVCPHWNRPGILLLFLCFLFLGVFLSQHMLLNSKALSCSTGWPFSPLLSGDAEISFRPLTWIFGLCSPYVLGSGSRVASHQAAAGKWTPHILKRDYWKVRSFL